MFCTLTGAPLDSSCVRQLLTLLAGKAGNDKRVHALWFRHTHAGELAREGRDHLGHRSLATTDRYLRDIAPKNASNAAGPAVGGIPGDFLMATDPRPPPWGWWPPQNTPAPACQGPWRAEG